MTIPVSAQATMSLGVRPGRFSGTLGEQMLRFLALDREERRHATIIVTSLVELNGWPAPRTYLDAEAIRELASEMTARGLI